MHYGTVRKDQTISNGFCWLIADGQQSNWCTSIFALPKLRNWVCGISHCTLL